MNDPRTLIDKLWAAHEIVRREDGESLLWVDRHYVHEGSFHAFSRLAERGTGVAEPGLTFAVADHYVPTRGPRHDIANPEIARMVRQIEDNAAKHAIRLFGLDDPRQGIVHVVGPEQGLSLAGPADRLRRQPHLDARRARRLCIRDRRLRGRACADDPDHLAAAAEDHADHGRRPRRARRRGEGHRARHHCPYRRRRRDRLRGRICRLRDQALSIEGRLTLCNMSIEAGARCGMIAPDDATFAYLKGRPYAPRGADFDRAVEAWSTLTTDGDARFDREVASRPQASRRS
jgi:3-isopropylmalate/(R)-2-methylmalate dehydratase large subunit